MVGHFLVVLKVGDCADGYRGSGSMIQRAASRLIIIYSPSRAEWLDTRTLLVTVSYTPRLYPRV
jgi:hypothetical protein